MLRRDSAVPLYQQIKEYLQRNIISGKFPANSRLPSERQLAEQFSVNRLTVSKALQELAQDGLIHSHVGKGTFVSPAKINQGLDTLSSFTEDMTLRGQRPHSRVLYAALQGADEESAAALHCKPGAEVVILRRVRLANEDPIALETSTLLARLCPGILEQHDFSQTSLYHVLQTQYGVRMVWAEQTIEARRPTPEEVQALGIPATSPILAITRVTFDIDRQPVEYVQSAYRGDRYKFHALLRQA